MYTLTPQFLRRIERIKIKQERELKSHIAKILDIPYQNVTMEMYFCFPHLTADEMKLIYQIAQSQNLPFEDVYTIIKTNPQIV